MTHLDDEDARLTTLLRTIRIPEPPADFLAVARRRYLEALEARYRRQVFTGLVAAFLVFGMAAAPLLSASEPATLIAWVAVTISSVARWMDGIGIVLALVPPVVWLSAVLGSVIPLLSIASIFRGRSLTVVK
jgi:hypothetical protein